MTKKNRPKMAVFGNLAKAVRHAKEHGNAVWKVRHGRCVLVAPEGPLWYVLWRYEEAKTGLCFGNSSRDVRGNAQIIDSHHAQIFAPDADAAVAMFHTLRLLK